MTSDIRIAFAQLDERAASIGARGVLDRISLRAYTVDVEIGAFQSERGRTQRVCFNVVVEVRPQADPIDDDVDRILSYDTISQAIHTELDAERLNLLETLAARIAERILVEPGAEVVFVRIEKLDRGPGALGVEIVRSKAKSKPVRDVVTDEDAARPHPIVVYLNSGALAADHLGGWLDQLANFGQPVILCVGMGQGGRPQSDVAAAQRRIDLLAIEQNAWRLAGRDRRCVVVQTRTELDWAARHGHMSVWAPSKLILDSTDGADLDICDPLAVVIWFAHEVAAAKIIAPGETTVPDADIPVTSVALTSENIFGSSTPVLYPPAKTVS